MKKVKWNSSIFFDFVMEILILLVIFILPTIFDRRLGIVFSGTKTAWMRVFGSVILGWWAIKLIVLRKHRFVRTPLDWPILSFLLCTTIATLTSIHVYTSFVGFYGRYEGLTSWYLFGLFFFVVTNYIKSFEKIKRIIVTVMSAATLMAVYSIIQRHAWDPYMWGGVITWQRVIGMIGQPNFLAAYMLMAFFLVLSLFLLDKGQGKEKINWSDQIIPTTYFMLAQVTLLFMIYNLEAYQVFPWYFGFSIVTASALLFSFSYDKLHPWVLNFILGLSLVLIYVSILYTQSRGGYLGLFTGIVLFAVVAGRQIIFSNWKKISILGFLIVLISGITMLRPEYSPFERFASEVTTEKEEVAGESETKLELKGAAGSRGETWKSAFNIITDYPFFGIGPEVLKMMFPRYETELFRFKEAFHVKQDRCHNETFDVGVTKGLIAFLVYVWLLFMLFRVGWFSAKKLVNHKHLIMAGLLAAILAFLVQNQFSFGVVAITSLFWVMWGMVMVLGESEDAGYGKSFSLEDIPWLPVAGVLILVVFLIYVSFFSFRADIWFKSGKTKMQTNRLPQAAVDFEKSLKIFPFEGGTISHLGIAYLNSSAASPEKTKLINQAVSVLKYGALVDPYNADNFYMLSKIYFMLSEWGDPQALVPARQNAEIAIKIDPYYAEVFHMLGAICEKEGKGKKAAENFERAFLINPNLIDSVRALENVYRKQGQPGEILKVLERIRTRYSSNLFVLEKIGKIYLERGENERAFMVADKIIGLDANFAPAYVLRGKLFAQRGSVNKAFSDLQQAVLLEPKNIAAHNELGRIYLLMKNKKRAGEEFEQVLRLDPQNAFAREMLLKVK